MRLTYHGEDRMDERVGLNAGAASRLAARALERGVRQHETAGALRRFLDAMAYRYGTRQVVYGEFVFAFGLQDALVTVINLPRELRPAARKALARKKGS